MGKEPKRRVLFVIGSMAGGGAERQTVNYLKFLDRGRYEPRLYLQYRQGELLDRLPADVPVTAFWDQVAMPRFNFPGRLHGLQARHLANFLAAERIDVVCAVTFLATLVVATAVQRRPTPWLAVEMADPRLDFDNEVTRFRWFKRRLLARAYRRAYRAVAVSDGVRDGLVAAYGVTAPHIAVVRNFLDLAEVDRLAAQTATPLAADRFHVVTVGRLNRQKGHIHLLQAIGELVQRGRTSLLLHLLGQGPLEAELAAFVRDRRLADHVHFAGFAVNPLPVVARCQLFCLPSLYEGLPLALLEALACRVPVVATDCPSGPREVLADGRNGRLVPPGDPVALAAAIAEAMDDYPAWAARTQDARRGMESVFSAEAEMSHLQDLIAAAARSAD